VSSRKTPSSDHLLYPSLIDSRVWDDRVQLSACRPIAPSVQMPGKSSDRQANTSPTGRSVIRSQSRPEIPSATSPIPDRVIAQFALFVCSVLLPACSNGPATATKPASNTAKAITHRRCCAHPNYPMPKYHRQDHRDAQEVQIRVAVGWGLLLNPRCNRRKRPGWIPGHGSQCGS
jgi:hypothetical protein